MEIGSLWQVGAMAGGAGALFAYARQIPMRLKGYLWAFFTTKITIRSDKESELFYWVQAWMTRSPKVEKVRDLFPVLRTGDNPIDKNKLGIAFSPGYSAHWFKFEGTHILISTQKEDKQQSGNVLTPPRDNLSLIFFTRSRKRVSKFFDRVISENLTDSNYRKIYLNGMWMSLGSLAKRSLDSVVLPEKSKRSITDSMDKFLSSEDWYVKMGIPYTLGLLFYGSPGSGKTSFISALAEKYHRNVYYLNISVFKDDDHLWGAMADAESSAIIVIEDVDCIGISKVRNNYHHGLVPKNAGYSTNTLDVTVPQPTAGVTLSGLLNVVDGFGASHGRVIIMTTNHIEKLDPALIRPGRVDVKVEFKHASREQIDTLFTRFYPDAPVSLCQGIPEDTLSMSALQQLFIETSNPEELLHLNGKLTELVDAQ